MLCIYYSYIKWYRRFFQPRPLKLEQVKFLATEMKEACSKRQSQQRDGRKRHLLFFPVETP